MLKRGDGKSWLLVAWNVLHLTEAKKADTTWWCVDRRCAVGERCFIYKPSKGMLLFFEVLKINESQGFCRSFGMATAEIKIVEIFEPPITARALKQVKEISQANFVKKNFQGKAFAIENQLTKAVLKLAASQKNPRKS
jgi:hypothetical protein